MKKSKINTTLTILAIVTSIFSCKSQNIDVIVSDYITNLKQFHIHTNKNEVTLIQKNFDSFYSKIQNNWSMYNQEQCIQAIDILNETTFRDDTVNVMNKMKVVEFYTTLLTTDSLSVRSAILTPLTTYKLTDYNREAKNNIEKLFSKENEKYLRAEVYKLAGFLQLKKAATYLIDRYLNKKEEIDRWSALLSLARMGNEIALDFCMKKLEKMSLEIEKSSDLRFISESAVYIRNNESLDLLIKLFNTNKKIRGISKPSIKTNIGYRALGYVKMSIINFPKRLYEMKEISYEDKINKIKNWLKENRKNLILNKNVY